jgi:hypothetical protein
VEIHSLQPSFTRSHDGGLYWTDSGFQEDYSEAVSPLVVKIDPRYSKAEVARLLHRLANGFEQGNDTRKGRAPTSDEDNLPF